MHVPDINSISSTAHIILCTAYAKQSKGQLLAFYVM